MTNEEIDRLVTALDMVATKCVRARRLKSKRQLRTAEQEMLIEIRTLVSRYLDIALWAGERDAKMTISIRETLKKCVSMQSSRNTSMARTIRKSFYEFEKFATAKPDNGRLKYA